jgi:trehalose 6-phosphate synthase
MAQDTFPGAAPAPLVVVANRLPIDARVDDDGAITWSPSPGGLVTALAPALAGRDAVWIGWSGIATQEPGESIDLPEHPDGYRLADVPLTAEQVELYYEGFSNETLWPLYHDRIVSPAFHRDTWNAYSEVNALFAEAAAREAAPGATVWVHDYQLQLVPALLRALRPDVRIGFFLHIPFPPGELFMQLPWRKRIVEGMLGAEVVGFQTPGGARNFREVAGRLLGYDVVSAVGDTSDDVAGWIDVTGQPPTPLDPVAPSGSRSVLVKAFPISIDVDSMMALASSPEVAERATQIRSDLGDPEILFLGVDRMDYTKGIDVRLRAFVELLEDGDLDPARVVLVQVATPSREQVEMYQRIRDDIELLVGRAAGAIGDIGQVPLRYMYGGMPRAELAAFYRAADVMLVTPFRDGMNLVAKEYVACRPDADGSLILSEFAGAAREFGDAWLVNPYSLESVKESILAAVRAEPAERQRRMERLREALIANDVAHWSLSFLSTLEGVGGGSTTA